MPIPRAMSTLLARLTEDSLTLARAAIVDLAAQTPRLCGIRRNVRELVPRRKLVGPDQVARAQCLAGRSGGVVPELAEPFPA